VGVGLLAERGLLMGQRMGIDATRPQSCWFTNGLAELNREKAGWTPVETSHVQFPIPAQRSPLDFLLI
jgi:hypothetical protein